MRKGVFWLVVLRYRIKVENLRQQKFEEADLIVSTVKKQKEINGVATQQPFFAYRVQDHGEGTAPAMVGRFSHLS